MTPVTAVVVTYNSASDIGACLEAASRYCHEVLVIDNASTDRTLEIVRQVSQGASNIRLIANRTNAGFAGAVNQGFAEATHEAVLILNPDAILLDPVDPVLAALAQPQIAAAAGLLVDADYRPQAGFSVRRLPRPIDLCLEVLGINRLWPTNPWNARYRCADLDLSQSQDVEQPAGAFVLVRREAWKAVNGFDASFFPVWFEDVDFASRLAAAGFRTRLIPSVRALHRGGHSVKQMSSELQSVYWYGSLLQYAAKRFNWLGKRVVFGSVACGVAVRWVLSWRVGIRATGLRRGYSKSFRSALRHLG